MSTIKTLAEAIIDVAAEHGEKTAVIFQDHTISYAKLNELIEHAADALAARGVRGGDRVATMLPNIPHFMIAYYAVLRLGAIVVPINVLYKEDEIAYILDDSGARMLITFEGFYARAGAAAKHSPTITEVIVVAQEQAPPGTVHWHAMPPLIEGEYPRHEPATVHPEDVAVICYTSGTTGRSKGAMLTHHNFIANCEQCRSLVRFGCRETDILLLVLPLFHIYAMNVGMNGAFLAGATIVLVPRFEVVPVLEAIQQHRCTVFLGAPPMYVGFVNSPELARFDLSSLRTANSGAAALPMQVLTQFESATGIMISEGYGLTETSPVTHSNAAGPVVKPGTIGPVLPGVEARLVDDEDRDVQPGAEGEIIVRGENIMLGYWRNPEATAEALRGGWFHTGDIATADHDGYYTIVDRKKDMINAGGFKIWPREVEEVLYHHPAVREAAVVAMPDAYAGERPLAYVALRQGQSASADELIAYCKERLASFKAPAQIEFRDELPKLPTGKVLRRQLREEARNTVASQTT